MLEAIEKLFFRSRWRRNEHAWGVWQGLGPLIPARLPHNGETMVMAGRVVRIYQRARRGSKATVWFGSSVGTQDTWWEHMQPPVDQWVVVHVHPWFPPGTHSGRMVLWVDHWEWWAPGDVQWRAQRHQRRLERENRTQESRVAGV